MRSASIPDARDASRKAPLHQLPYQQVGHIRRMNDLESTRKHQAGLIAPPPRTVLDIGATGQHPLQAGVFYLVEGSVMVANCVTDRRQAQQGIRNLAEGGLIRHLRSA